METAAEADIILCQRLSQVARRRRGATSYSAGGIGGGMPAAPANGSGSGPEGGGGGL